MSQSNQIAITSESIRFPCGLAMPNRWGLAPMTNTQSNEDGTLHQDEYHWLTMRAEGGHGMTMTCASHVSAIGQGFPKQLGIFDDLHIEGLKRLAEGIRLHNSLSIVQLHHGGIRSPKQLIKTTPVGPSDHERTGSRALSHLEVLGVIKDFVDAAERAQKAGFDGVEIHGAHGYLLAQFLDETLNHRNDEYGGSHQNRARILFEIIDQIRQRCGKEFCIGIRLSPEGGGMTAANAKRLCQNLIDTGQLDFLDLSLWDCFKAPEETNIGSTSLIEYFTDLDTKGVKIAVAGALRQPEDIRKAFQYPVDFVLLGRASILHHDFPIRFETQPDFRAAELPVSSQHLAEEGLSSSFIDYMKRWRGFVEDGS